MGSCHPGAFMLGNQRNLAFPDRSAAGGKVMVASSKRTSTTEKDFSCNFIFHLSLS